jgi:poly-beta-1,6-N-acetyl-D-glucosamine synthase
MLTNLFVRVAFITLLAASLSINAFVFSAFWLIPPVVAMLLNLRIARTMKYCDNRDVLFAVLFLPAEMFMWVRIGHFLRSWSRFLSKKKVDNWAMQAKAERGGGSLGYWVPAILLIAVLIASAAIWSILGPVAQSSILWVGWPIVGVVTVLQTLLMFSKLVRRHHGYKV